MTRPRTPNEKGWPRQKLDYEDYVDDTGERHVVSQKPNIWLGGDHQKEGNWTQFAEGREVEAMKENLCVVCGCKMRGVMVFLRMWTRHYISWQDREDRALPKTWEAEFMPAVTDGPAGHPRCINVAANVCPHVADRPEAQKFSVVIAYVAGPGVDPYPVKSEGMTGTLSIDGLPGLIPLTRKELHELGRRHPLGV